MTSELFVNAGPGETRIAWRESGRLSELAVDRGEGGRSILGNVYLGRVAKVMGGLQAAFVDIGRPRDGFLALPEARPVESDLNGKDGRIGDYLKEGDAVLVQVLRDEIEEKGAKLTTRITVPGVFLVLTAGGSDIHLSRHIDDDQEAVRLRGIIEANRRETEGFIVRTAAVGARDEDIEREMISLRERRTGMDTEAEGKAPPLCVYREPLPVHRCIRMAAGRTLARIVIDDRSVYNGARKYCEREAPFLVDKIEFYQAAQPIFEAYGIEDEIETALAPRIDLASGGRIHIGHTAALTAIDIDTGGAGGRGGQEETNVTVNLEAAVEIARQMRLRNIGGYILIDFVPMKRRENKEKVLSVLRDHLARESCPSFVAGFTKLGKVELTRRRRHESMANVLLEGESRADSYQREKSIETVAFEALRVVMREDRANSGKGLELQAGGALVDMLRHGRAKPGLDQANETLGYPLKISVRGDWPDRRYEVMSREGPSGS
ncbi:MAG: Rne/Rng family ribonuclease [Rhodospirillales bacterium]